MFKISSSLRSSLLLGAATIAAISLSSAAFAAGEIETVVVTGSHIASPNLESSSPIATLSSEDISIRGTTKLEDLINQMPAVFAGQTAATSNGATGTATVDLRGMGCDRTLVLMDGRRMSYGSPLDSCADLNQIPAMLIERVEVLTGGASATYGSDAIAGVVNFITKKDFEGFQVDAQYSTFEHNNDYSGPGDLRTVIAYRGSTNPDQFKLPDDIVWDGAGKQISAIMGVSSANGKGNVTAYFSYRQNDQIIEANRDYSSCSLGGQNNISIGGVTKVRFTCGGSGTSYPGYFTDFSTFGYTLDTSTGNTFTNYSSTLNAYNYGPLNYYQRPDERYAFGAFGHYEINSHAELYAQLNFANYSTTAQIAPTGDFFSTGSINCGNPLLSASQKSDIGCTSTMITNDESTMLYIGRRNVEGGGRQDSLRNTSYRSVFGVRGDIDGNWNYDVNGQFSRVELSRAYLNEFSKTRLMKAINVVDDGSGNAVCASYLDGTDPNCVPYNIFTIGGVTQEALSYLQVPLVETGYTQQLSVTALITGDLGAYGFVSPWAVSPVQVALGFEYRQDTLSTTPDVSFSTGDGAGQGGATIGLTGSTHVSEGFLEVKVPVAENQYLAKQITVDLGYRYSEYDAISTTTYKIGLNWAPTDDLRLRGGFDHAVRAPNVFELYTEQGYNLFDMVGDPCGAGGYASLTACQSTPGAGTAPWYGSGALNSPAQQYNFLQGGNPALDAETADTFTVGFVATPTAIPGLVASVDYFDIKVYGLIGTTGSENILSACYNDGDAASCARINRNALGQLWVTGGYVEDLNTNIGGVKTSGVDFNINYQLDLEDVSLTGGGVLNFALNTTWLNKLTTDSGTGVINVCVGYYGSSCGTPNPAWRSNFRIGWNMPWSDAVLTGTWRYIGQVKRYGGTPGTLDYQFPGMSYFDLAAAVPVLTNAELRFGVNNVLDTDPPLSPIVGTTGNGNTYPQTYDAYGRYLFTAITLKL